MPVVTSEAPTLYGTNGPGGEPSRQRDLGGGGGEGRSVELKRKKRINSATARTYGQVIEILDSGKRSTEGGAVLAFEGAGLTAGLLAPSEAL